MATRASDFTVHRQSSILFFFDFLFSFLPLIYIHVRINTRAQLIFQPVGSLLFFNAASGVSSLPPPSLLHLIERFCSRDTRWRQSDDLERENVVELGKARAGDTEGREGAIRIAWCRRKNHHSYGPQAHILYSFLLLLTKQTDYLFGYLLRA